MFQAPDGNPYGAKFYGTAAVSAALGGDWWQAPGCRKCWSLTGKSTIDKSISTVVVRGANFCSDSNPACANGKYHFDLAAPGFDFTASSDRAKCDSLEPASADGLKSCEMWMQDGNADHNCNCSAISQPTLQAGCKNFLSLMWNNIEVDFEEVACPPELLETPCGTDGTWPSEPMPDTCRFFGTSGGPP